MIKLMFKVKSEYFIITIDSLIIKYYDKYMGKLWGTSLQYLPPDATATAKIKASRNKIPAGFIDLLTIPKEELAEYTNAKTDEELKQIVLKDARKNACELVEEK